MTVEATDSGRRVRRAAGVLAAALVVALATTSAGGVGSASADVGTGDPSGRLSGLAGVAAAIATADGTAGYCPDDNGVTVVVDLSALGGDIVVRCAPGPVGSAYDGVDALRDAGFTPTGTQRWGLAFVCRIQGRPAASESLDTDSNSDYHERCVDTPPTDAYWGYWYARNEGEWRYSSAGPKSHQPIEGGFEGWAFSLNHAAGEQPAPGVAPTRPKADPPPTSPSTSPSTPPTSPSPNPEPSRHATSGPAGPRDGSPGSTSSAPTPSTGPSTSAAGPSPTRDRATPQGNPQRTQQQGSRREKTSGEHKAGTPTAAAATTQSGTQVTGELPPVEDGGSAGGVTATVLGAGLLVLLGAGAGIAAWRRARRS
ncbi:MAG TPA: hypothetical protein VH419_03550 [Nocardioidaceae bacterium]